MQAELFRAKCLVYADLCESANEFLDKKDMDAAVESGETALLRPELGEAVSDAFVEDELPTTTVELLAALHGVQGIEQQRQKH